MVLRTAFSPRSLEATQLLSPPQIVLLAGTHGHKAHGQTLPQCLHTQLQAEASCQLKLTHAPSWQAGFFYYAEALRLRGWKHKGK